MYHHFLGETDENTSLGNLILVGQTWKLSVTDGNTSLGDLILVGLTERV